MYATVTTDTKSSRNKLFTQHSITQGESLESCSHSKKSLQNVGKMPRVYTLYCYTMFEIMHKIHGT